MALLRWRLWLVVLTGGVVLAIVAAVIVNPQLTRYVESQAFREELDRQTSKGLHFHGQYKAIQRTGLLTARTEGFTGSDGVKAIKAISTGEVEAKFNPLGVFLRRWQLDYLRIPSGTVEIQTYEPKPENKPPKPWYAVFLPDRVYLKEVKCDVADITWQLRGRKAGFFKTRLMLTPHGRDFDYWANGGTMKTGMVPNLALRQVHLLVTKELLTLYELELAPNSESEGRIRVKGQAGMKEDKSLSVEMNFSGIPVDPWIPEAWASLFRGVASGDVVWKGSDMRLESSSGRGAFRIEGGRVAGAPFLNQAAVLTGKKSIEEIKLNRCALEFEWKYPRAEIKQIEIEAEGAFSIQGAARIDDQSLSGSVQFGVTRKYLEWLPRAEEIFAREKGRLSLDDCKTGGERAITSGRSESACGRVVEEMPGTAVGIFFRQVGEWFENVLGEK
jgi:hypothetical protein